MNDLETKLRRFGATGHLAGILALFAVLAVAAIYAVTQDVHALFALPAAGAFPFMIGATNEVFDRGVAINVVLSDPATGGTSGAPGRVGPVTGILIANQATDGSATLALRGVYSLSVKGVNDGGNVAVAIGDPIFYVDADTPKLSKKSSGRLFGYALAAVTSGSTATINVLLDDGTAAVSGSLDIPSDIALVTTGKLQVNGGTGLFGYATGAGGAVTQITSSSTGVTLNKPAGQITTVALTTAAAAEERFTVTNSQVAATDAIALGTTYNGAGTPAVSVLNVAAGAFDIVITNLHAVNALNAVLVVNFAIIKAVAA